MFLSYNKSVMKKSELIFSSLLVPVDFLMFLFAGIVAYFLVSILGILVFAISGLYNISARKRLFKDFFQIVIAVSATLLVVILYIFFSSQLFESRFIILMAWVLAIFFISLGRFFVKKW